MTPDRRELSRDRIEEARRLIDPAFLDTPLIADPALDRALGLSLYLKDETQNPIRSFKGRGTGYFVAAALVAGTRVVAASAGNFGQGLAYNASRRGHPVTVFAAENANPVKIEAMRRFGGDVILHGADFDAAKDAARVYAERHGAVFVEDGDIPAIAEGAGTLAAEVTERATPLDAFVVPLGNGALATGVGCWLKAVSPKTKVIAVAAERAPAMALSWHQHRVVTTAQADTIADGIAVRVPVPFALATMYRTVDEVMLVSEDDLRAAMTWIHARTGRLTEPAGAAGVAGILRRREEFAGKRIATALCGANLTGAQIAAWFPG